MAREQLNRRALIESLVRLRRAERMTDGSARAEIDAVLTQLEELVGPTVGRSEAARLLGISHTALDRWIDKGDVAAVLTPRGRREIPLTELVGLLEEMNEDGDEQSAAPLASVIRERRLRAEAFDPGELLPRRRSDDLHSLLYHRLVARTLDEKEVRNARRRLRRWRDHGRIHPQWADEWDRLLALPPRRIARLIALDSEEARGLRQNSPFAGALTEQERRRLLHTIQRFAA